jgi:cytochrome c oxidase subunit II
MIKKLFALPLFALAALLSVPALAGKPEPWQMGMQEAVTPVAERLHEFHDFTLYIIVAITIFVLLLLLYVIVRFNEKANPVPSKTTHNVVIEVIWTVIPVLILIVIAIPSFKLLYYSDRTVNPEMTLKVTGYQWYWGYEYPDQGGINFTANMIADKDLQEGQVRQLSTDNPVVIPVDTNIQVLVTAADVLHAFAVPAFGVKKDAVPGRTNETWMRVTKEGTYYGQCSELCGTGHGFMPLEFKVVSKDAFKEWVAMKKKEQGIADTPVPAAVDAAVPANNSTEQVPAASH